MIHVVESGKEGYAFKADGTVDEDLPMPAQNTSNERILADVAADTDPDHQAVRVGDQVLAGGRIFAAEALCGWLVTEEEIQIGGKSCRPASKKYSPKPDSPPS